MPVPLHLLPRRSRLPGLVGTVISLTLLGMGLLAPVTGHAQLTVRITQGLEGAQPIAVVPFGFDQPGAALPQPIGEIIAADLARTGQFDPYPASDLPSRPTQPDDINFGDWRLLGAPNLVIGSVRAGAQPDTYVVAFRLYDVFRANQLTGFEIQATSASLRRAAHQASDIIYEELTGERGAFDTRIAYVTEGRSGDASSYALHVADSDGFNPQTVLNSREPILSPAWSPDGNKLAYMTYQERRAQVFVQDVATGTRESVSAERGLNGAPAWSPDGRRLALTLSKDGNPEVYVLELPGRRLLRVTQSEAIDTEPTWSPDGRFLVFTSDRGGGPQLYRVPATGGRPERLTFEGGYNAGGQYSPDGKQIAFVHGGSGGYRIAVLDTETRNMSVLTDTSLDESPTFAPNGRMILYATVQGGRQALAAVSSDGRVRQQLAGTRGKVREPSWSGFRSR